MPNLNLTELRETFAKSTQWSSIVPPESYYVWAAKAHNTYSQLLDRCEAADDLFRMLEIFTASRGMLVARCTSHDFIDICNCGGCSLYRLLDKSDEALAAYRKAVEGK